MLTLILGDIGTGKTTRLVNAIRDDVQNGVHSFLIVPEQKTVSSERRMADLLPPSSCLTFEVTNFTRLCDSIFRLCGGIAGKVCDSMAENLLMWRTMSELSPLLTTLRHRPDAASVGKMLASIRELHSHRLTPALLQLAASSLSNEALANKVRDYALIWSTFTALVEEHYTISQDRLDKGIELLSLHKPFVNYHIYIDDFGSYTEQELALIAALLETCDVTITLSMPKDAKKQLCADEVLLTKDRLISLATQTSTTWQKIELNDSWRQVSPAIRFAEDHIFRIDYTALPSYTGGADEHLKLVEVAEPTDACHYIAADILRRTTQEGARFSDFTIVCGSGNTYAGILDMVLEKNHIPFFFSRPDDFLSLECVKSIFTAYNIICHGWQKEDVIAYLKCGITPISPDVCDEIELYAETWKLQGKSWYDGSPWSMSANGFNKPYGDEKEVYLNQLLARINEAKSLFVPPIYNFAQKIGDDVTVDTHIQALTAFLLDLEMPALLEERSKENKSYEQLWIAICNALDTMHDLLSDVTMSAEDFSAIFKMLLSSEKPQRIPSQIDEVTVGQASLLRSECVKYVYLLGVNDGEFPETVKDDGAFTEQEREMLSQAGANTSDSLSIRACRELFSFRRAMALAEDNLTILWSRASSTLQPIAPSDAVLRLRIILGSDYPVLYLGKEHLADLIWTPDVALERLGQTQNTALGEAVRQLLMQDQARSGAVDALDIHLCNSDHQLSSEVTQRLYSEDLATTQSRIASFLKCPFSYFCKFTLHLEGEKKGEFDDFSMGTFVHAILEAFFMKAREWKKDIHALDEHEQEKILDTILPFVIKDAIPAEELTNPRTAFLLNSLVAKTKIIIASMCEELSHSAFEPAFFELKIAPGNSIAPPPVSFTAEDGSRVYVYGTIDRVDKLVINGNVYVRVVDYKTGSATITQNSVRKGEDLQMPLYLFSLLGAQNSQFRTKLGAKNGEILPAGVMYMSSLMDESDSENQFVRSGLFLYDETVLHAMDDTPDSQYISIKRTKQGKITAASQKRLLTQEGFQALLQDMGELLTGIASRIKHGDATASPMKATGAYSTCSSCAYKPICRHVTRPKEDEDTSEE